MVAQVIPIQIHLVQALIRPVPKDRVDAVALHQLPIKHQTKQKHNRQQLQQKNQIQIHHQQHHQKQKMKNPIQLYRINQRQLQLQPKHMPNHSNIIKKKLIIDHQSIPVMKMFQQPKRNRPKQNVYKMKLKRKHWRQITNQKMRNHRVICRRWAEKHHHQ